MFVSHAATLAVSRSASRDADAEHQEEGGDDQEGGAQPDPIGQLSEQKGRAPDRKT